MARPKMRLGERLDRRREYWQGVLTAGGSPQSRGGPATRAGLGEHEVPITGTSSRRWVGSPTSWACRSAPCCSLHTLRTGALSGEVDVTTGYLADDGAGAALRLTTGPVVAELWC